MYTVARKVPNSTAYELIAMTPVKGLANQILSFLQDNYAKESFELLAAARNMDSASVPNMVALIQDVIDDMEHDGLIEA